MQTVRPLVDSMQSKQNYRSKKSQRYLTRQRHGVPDSPHTDMPGMDDDTDLDAELVDTSWQLNAISFLDDLH